MNTNIWKKQNVARFNFTYALMDGAWLETKPFITSDGHKTERNWFSHSMIDQILGKGEFHSLFRKQGQFTGCWIDV